MKHYKFWHFELSMGLATVYTGTGFKKGAGFDCTIRIIELKWRWRRIFKLITDIYIRT